MAIVDLVYAHPYPDRSRANRALLAAVSDVPEVEVRSLYERYPDFDLDVEAEQRALEACSAVIWQHPMYWYSTPGLMKHWFDKVLTKGWAYGDGSALRGKPCLWVVTTGGGRDAFAPEGMHGAAFEAFVPHVAQTARFCGMRWEEPFVVHGAHGISPAELEAAGGAYRARVERLIAGAEGRDG